MRISRKKRPQKSLVPRYNKNEHIQAPEVRVLDTDKSNLGLMRTSDALKLAEEREMDLVEINPKANPPVAQLINFANFKYQKEKEARKQRAKQKTGDTKGIRLSMRIGDHDMGIRLEQGKKFLSRGDKLKVEMILRGRENKKIDLGIEVIDRYLERLNEEVPVQYEQKPGKQGNKLTALVAKK